MKYNYQGKDYEISEKYSFKDLTGRYLRNETDMNGLIIYGTCLSHENPDSEILPKDLEGTTFIRCNLSNVFIPSGNFVIDCLTIRFKVQNDREDWEIDKYNNPIRPLSYKSYIKQGIEVPKPENLPKTMKEPIWY